MDERRDGLTDKGDIIEPVASLVHIKLLENDIRIYRLIFSKSMLMKAIDTIFKLFQILRPESDYSNIRFCGAVQYRYLSLKNA